MGRVGKASVILVALVVLAAAATWRFHGTPRPAEESGIVMDTFVRVRAYGPRAGEAAKAAMEEFQRIDLLLNPYDEKSEIAAVNRNAGRGAVRVSPETFQVIEEALKYARLSDGAFDPTVLPLVTAWGFQGTPAVPGEDRLAVARSLVDYRSVVLDSTGMTVFLAREGMGLDLGGIAKGYATDRAAAVLRAMGVRSALIDAGGNVYAMGRKPGLWRGSKWTIGIQHPRKPDAYLATVELEDETAVTSGDYQRYFESGGVRYHHIIDPVTGYPARGLASVTIVGASSTAADALSTAVFVLGPERGARLLDRQAGYGAVLASEGGEISVTENIRARTEPVTTP